MGQFYHKISLTKFVVWLAALTSAVTANPLQQSKTAVPDIGHYISELTKRVDSVRDTCNADVSKLRAELSGQTNLGLSLEYRLQQQETLIETLQEEVVTLSTRNAPQQSPARVNRVDTRTIHSRTDHSTSDTREDAGPYVYNSSRSDGGMLERRRRATHAPVAFLATVTPSTLTFGGTKQEIVFDHVVFNMGGAYLNRQGSFIAPVTGVYIFSTSITSAGGDDFQAAIQVNGTPIARTIAHGGSGQPDQGSLTVVYRLAAGDVVSVERFFVGHSVSGNSGLTTFTGCLLQQTQ